MPVIRLDTDQAATTLQAMRAAQQQLGETRDRLTASIQQLDPTWESRAKLGFMTAWEEWRQGFERTLTTLEPIIIGVQREKDELEQADQSSSYA